MPITKQSCVYYNALKEGVFIKSILLYEPSHPLTVKPNEAAD